KGDAPRYGPGAFPEIPWPEPTRVPPPWEGGDGKARDQAATLAGGGGGGRPPRTRRECRLRRGGALPLATPGTGPARLLSGGCGHLRRGWSGGPGWRTGSTGCSSTGVSTASSAPASG